MADQNGTDSGTDSRRFSRKRAARPWLRKGRGWFIWRDGKQIFLGKNKRDADEAFHRLFLGQSTYTAGNLAIEDAAALFLEWSLIHNAKVTYEAHRSYLARFLKWYGGKKPCAELKRLDVERWVASVKSFGPAGKRRATRTIKQVLRWCVEEGHLGKSPIAGLKLPPASRRETVLTEEQVELIKSLCSNEFRDLVEMLAETGCRPQDARLVEARHFSGELKVVTFPANEHKTGKKTGSPRTIFLTPRAFKICVRLAERHQTGPLFRNEKGKPWTSNAVRCQWRRLRAKHDNLPRNLCAYLFRHSFATKAILNGVDLESLRTLMGHVDVTMLSKHYAHLVGEVNHLHAAAMKARGISSAGASDEGRLG